MSQKPRGENILEEETVQCLYKYGAYIQLVGTFYKQRRLLVNILFFSMFSVMILIFSMKWTEHQYLNLFIHLLQENPGLSIFLVNNQNILVGSSYAAWFGEEEVSSRIGIDIWGLP